MIGISLQYQNWNYYQELAEGQKLSFGTHKKDTVQVDGMVESQVEVTAGNNQLTVQVKPPFHCQTDAVSIGSLVPLESGSGARIFSCRVTGKARQTAALPYNGILRIGRAAGNDITIVLPFISAKHLAIRCQDGLIRVEDQGSTNGLYLNGRRIEAALLHSGDVLNILTVRIKLVNGQLEFYNVGNSLKITADPQTPIGEQTPASQGDKLLHYRCSPRIQDSLPKSTIVLDRPPKKGQEYHPSGSRIASMISMGAMAGTTLAMGMMSPALAFARTISVAAGIYNMAAGSKLEKQRRAEMEEYNRRREEEYKTYIEAQRAQIAAVAAEQRRIISAENPAPEQCLKIVEQLDRSLWERMPADRDFLDIRMGMGYEELCVPIKNYAENRGLMMEDDELEDLCNDIAEENRIVDFIPTRIALRSTPTVGIIGDRNRAVHLVRNMLVSLATQHSPNDVQLVGIFDDSERTRWASLRWLPHIWDNSHQLRYLAYDQKRAHNICEMLHDLLKRRLGSLKSEDGRKAPAPTPRYVILLGSRELVQREPVMELLAAGDPRLGVSTIFLYDTLYALPQECGCFIDLREEHPSIYGRHNANQRAVFSTDPPVSSQQFSAFARRLAAIELEDNRLRSALPSSLPFLEGLGVQTVEELNVLYRWRSHPVTDCLAAPIGVLANGKPFCLDIHYKAHGAHGLLAGTTGSGKSELLRTWILSMAVNYHPHQVNFVIIDYKGGGMANKLEELPHMVGKITNIDTNISRSLVSLKREAKRRMLMLQGCPGVDDVDQYMQLYHAGKVTEPMPHLIIVSDEFAELKKEEPEFLKELSSLARVGRSVGIHLVLATQRPAGVVDDQIDSNARFRICMKVNSVQDSKELLKRPDAAAITQCGRAYVRIGEDELFDLFQSYWSGAEYTGTQANAAQLSNQVRIVDVSGERIQHTGPAPAKKQAVGSDQLTAVVHYISAQAKLAQIRRLPAPWRPELPTLLPLQVLGIPNRFDGEDWPGAAPWLNVPVGLYDRPAMQEQGIQYLRFTDTPHYGIYGGPASGKTTLLKTLILSMALQFSPAEVNLYILDFGGRSLSVFEELPHVALIVQEDQADKLEKFTAWLQGEISDRKKVFEKEKVAGFEQYRQKKKDLPAIFVVIDNLLRLSTMFSEMDPFWIELSIAGSDCGVHLVFTSNNINKTSINLRTNIGGNIALHMTDANDYRVAIAEFPEGSRPPAVPGRALIRDTAAAEFQTAMFLSGEGADQDTNALEKLIRQMADGWDGPKPQKLRSMPDRVCLTDMAECYACSQLLPLGLSYGDQQPVYMDLREKHTMLLSAADAQEGVEALKTLAKLLSSKPDNRLYVLDGSGTLGAIPGHVYAQGAQLDRAVDELTAELCRREDVLLASQTLDPGEPQLCLLLQDPQRIMEQLSEERRQMLLRLCQSTEDLGMIALASANTQDLGLYMYTENLTMAFIDSPMMGSAENSQKGLCIGGKVRSHDYLQQQALSQEERGMKLAPGDAMVFDCGKAIRIKFMQE